MAEHRPKGCDGRAFCPYSDWRDGERRSKEIESLGPYAHTGEPRYRCKPCGASFLEPSHYGAHLVPFGKYRVDEAILAHFAHGEVMADAARRLGVTPRSAYRWAEDLRSLGQQRATAHVRSLARQLELSKCRWFRRVGRIKGAPYAVDGEDRLAYDRASIGEIAFLLNRERVVAKDQVREWMAAASDAHAKLATREAAIKKARRALFKALPHLRHVEST